MNRRVFLLAATALQAQTPGGRRVLILLGPPGAGKTTHAKNLSKKYSIPTLSAADLLKKSHGRKDNMSRALKIEIEGGDLINDEGVNELMKARFTKGDCYNGFILDGYPTTKAQAEFLAAQLKELTFPEPVVIHLQITDQQAQERLRRRRRADDKPANIERRLADYRNEESTVLGLYKDVIHIDASPDERTVWTAIQNALDQRK
jgi:adenylate kinase